MTKMSTVWDRTAEFLTDNLGAVLPLALLAFFVPASIVGSLANVDASDAPQLALILALIQLAFGILSLWGMLALTAMALDPDTAPQAGNIAGRRLLPTLAIWVAMIVVIVVLAAPVLLVLGIDGADFFGPTRTSGLDVSPVAALGVSLYMLILIALLLWAGARLALVMPAIVAERQAFGSLARSWALTRGLTWRIVGVLLLYTLVSWVATLAAQTVFGSIFRLISGPDEGLSLSRVLTSVMAAAVQTGFTVLLPVFAAKLYLAVTAGRAPAA